SPRHRAPTSRSSRPDEIRRDRRAYRRSRVFRGSRLCYRWGVARTLGNGAGNAPSLNYERAFWRAGLTRVAGVDEVGRGALAGPLVAAAVVLPACGGWELRRLRS